jgi:hypothetical protein
MWSRNGDLIKVDQGEGLDSNIEVPSHISNNIALYKETWRWEVLEVTMGLDSLE